MTSLLRVTCLALCTLLLSGIGVAQELESKDAMELFRKGEYSKCVDLCNKGIEANPWVEDWWLYKIRSLMAGGEYEDALKTAEAGLRRFSTSIRLRWEARKVYLYNSKPTEAGKMMGEINRLAEDAPWRYSDPVNRIYLGRFLLENGYDGRQVLELVYDRVKKEKPDYVDAYLASAELALTKNDSGLALSELAKAERLKPNRANYYYLLARAQAATEWEAAAGNLQKAIELNPKHAGAHLMLAGHLIDGERYSEAKRILMDVLTFNRFEPKAWAYMAVIAHLESDFENEGIYRGCALAWYRLNPNVDHLIGKKLSQKYRFSEGRRYQERALRMEKDFVDAKIQLSQDLLRLGEEEAGWKLAHEVYENDGYNVVAHNLVELERNIAKFRTIEADGFLIRMSAEEAAIYGDQVVDILSEARRVLCEKYEIKLKEPTIVEIFPQQKDFAIRTFGLPGGAGFLGVCFGRVITANSPAALGETESNWESVLWHEFCHVVTLQKTNNRMPRWLSEGISVYEERQRDPTWGQRMTPAYRQFVMGGGLTPIAELSDAFLAPPSAMHLQFAYYQSSLVVEYLVQEHGLERLKRVLRDLSVGMPINESLTRHIGDLQALNIAFTAFAKEKAETLAPKANWKAPELDPKLNLFQVQAWNLKHKNSLTGMQREAQLLLTEKRWEDAEKPLRRMIELYPDDHQSGNAYELLALALRSQEKTKEEEKVLTKLAKISADSSSTFLRLIQLAEKRNDWKAVSTYAAKQMAVNPLTASIHISMAKAARETKQPKLAIRSLRSLLQLNPVDPAKTHYELAQLLWDQKQQKEARRQVLLSLEQAPRYQAAQTLLLEIVAKTKKTTTKKSPTDKDTTAKASNTTAKPTVAKKNSDNAGSTGAAVKKVSK